ncbi:MAG TPA: hypothetical protein VNK95_05160 [Caldilineaceae bacterium]|nr:hypothetical protein [Caldilineaceae bacterium]
MAKAGTAAVPPLLRIAGRDRSPADLLEAAVAAGLPITVLPGGGQLEDGAAVDLTLAAQPGPLDTPPPGASYAGLSPAQRLAFLNWARQPAAPAAAAFQQLYIANLEARLLGSESEYSAARQELLRLTHIPAWAGNLWLGRAMLLCFWLTRDGPGLAEWLAQSGAPVPLLGVALGLQALLGCPLTPGELGVALAAWTISQSELSPDLLKLRLASLTSALGEEPLRYALNRLGEQASRPQPWRTAHRSLRIALPQPDLRPLLEEPLADMLVVADVVEETAEPASPGDGAAAADDGAWQLVLEFGHSRSEFFNQVLARCQRLPGFTQLLDENRTLVYRVTFTRSELRRFWQIWDYVQGWSTAKVYVNGTELEKWKVWPYSQYLR